MKPPASKRTLSLITGKTDIEDPATGRDGTKATPRPQRPSRKGKKVEWTGGVSSWRPDNRNDLAHEVRLDGDWYQVWCRDTLVGHAATVIDAGKLCEEHMAGCPLA